MLEFLKPFFNGGTISFEDLQNAAGQANIKAVNLADGGYMSISKYNDDIKTRDGQISTLNATITAKDQEIEDLKKAAEADKAKHAKELDHEQYVNDCREFARDKGFNSTAARNWFVEQLVKKNLERKDGELVGADEYLEEYRAQNPDSFGENKPGEPHAVNRQKAKEPLPRKSLAERMNEASRKQWKGND